MKRKKRFKAISCKEEFVLDSIEAEDENGYDLISSCCTQPDMSVIYDDKFRVASPAQYADILLIFKLRE